MQFRCKVIGHELCIKQEQEWLKVKLKGTLDAVKGEVLVPPIDRARYPLGAPVLLDFTVKQTDLPLAEEVDEFNRGARRRGARAHAEVTPPADADAL